MIAPLRRCGLEIGRPTKERASSRVHRPRVAGTLPTISRDRPHPEGRERQCVRQSRDSLDFINPAVAAIDPITGMLTGIDRGTVTVTVTSEGKSATGGLLFQSISSGYGHSCGVTDSRQVFCWGLNGSGQLGSSVANGSTPMRAGSIEAIEVAASGIGTGNGAHSCAIGANRLTVWCWGRNDTGQLGNGSTTAGAASNPSPGVVVTQKPL